MDMITRPEKVQQVMDMLGSLASEQDAEMVLDALEARGHQFVRRVHEDAGIQIVLDPALTDEEFWALVDAVIPPA